MNTEALEIFKTIGAIVSPIITLIGFLFVFRQF